MRRYFTAQVEHFAVAAADALQEPAPDAEHRGQHNQRNDRQLNRKLEHDRDGNESLEDGCNEFGEVARHQVAELIRIAGKARNDLTGSRFPEEAHVQVQHVCIRLVPEIARDTLLDFHDQVRLKEIKNVLDEKNAKN